MKRKKFRKIRTCKYCDTFFVSVAKGGKVCDKCKKRRYKRALKRREQRKIQKKAHQQKLEFEELLEYLSNKPL